MRTGMIALLVWICLAGSGAAQSERVRLEWERWLDRVGATEASLVFMIENAELSIEARGIAPDTPMPLASNSKAITALCLEALVREGKLAWDDRVARWYPSVRTELTVADLVVHRAGLGRDSTQRKMPRWRGDRTPRWAEVRAAAFARKKHAAPAKRYRYSNENYAILGDLIEVLSGQPYERACRSRVLERFGVQGVLGDAYGGFGPWGGWSMSVRDYALLLRKGYVGRDPQAGPYAPVAESGKVIYGLGMLARLSPYTPNQWHVGSLCFGGQGHGALAMNLGGRYTVVAAYNTCASPAEREALERSLVKAIFAD
ncbi:serine hydrolase domain-containing protein [Thalassococcus lentus]|uniref:Serine hydrolase n=1 Tax=Thalassococcus lentus TaxID=1210524 RepID=A0ABT4XXS5_9RHOB|nr:serine hydrolase domain-containing protein [Thalassococcus lentus]MDA7426751.1 serine hydrolase [Thalassococcus lentus]